MISEKNIGLFAKYGIFTRDEILSRYEINLETYCKTLNIEALTMIDMVKKDIIPAVSAYANELTVAANNKKQLSADINVDTGVDTCYKNFGAFGFNV